MSASSPWANVLKNKSASPGGDNTPGESETPTKQPAFANVKLRNVASPAATPTSVEKKIEPSPGSARDSPKQPAFANVKLKSVTQSTTPSTPVTAASSSSAASQPAFAGVKLKTVRDSPANAEIEAEKQMSSSTKISGNQIWAKPSTPVQVVGVSASTGSGNKPKQSPSLNKLAAFLSTESPSPPSSPGSSQRAENTESIGLSSSKSSDRSSSKEVLLSKSAQKADDPTLIAAGSFASPTTTVLRNKIVPPPGSSSTIESPNATTSPFKVQLKKVIAKPSDFNSQSQELLDPDGPSALQVKLKTVAEKRVDVTAHASPPTGKESVSPVFAVKLKSVADKPADYIGSSPSFSSISPSSESKTVESSQVSATPAFAIKLKAVAEKPADFSATSPSGDIKSIEKPSASPAFAIKLKPVSEKPADYASDANSTPAEIPKPSSPGKSLNEFMTSYPLPGHDTKQFSESSSGTAPGKATDAPSPLRSLTAFKIDSTAPSDKDQRTEESKVAPSSSSPSRVKSLADFIGASPSKSIKDQAPASSKTPSEEVEAKTVVDLTKNSNLGQTDGWDPQNATSSPIFPVKLKSIASKPSDYQAISPSSQTVQSMHGETNSPVFSVKLKSVSNKPADFAGSSPSLSANEPINVERNVASPALQVRLKTVTGKPADYAGPSPQQAPSSNSVDSGLGEEFVLGDSQQGETPLKSKQISSKEERTTPGTAKTSPSSNSPSRLIQFLAQTSPPTSPSGSNAPDSSFIEASSSGITVDALKPKTPISGLALGAATNIHDSGGSPKAIHSSLHQSSRDAAKDPSRSDSKAKSKSSENNPLASFLSTATSPPVAPLEQSTQHASSDNQMGEATLPHPVGLVTSGVAVDGSKDTPSRSPIGDDSAMPNEENIMMGQSLPAITDNGIATDNFHDNNPDNVNASTSAPPKIDDSATPPPPNLLSEKPSLAAFLSSLATPSISTLATSPSNSSPTEKPQNPLQSDSEGFSVDPSNLSPATAGSSLMSLKPAGVGDNPKDSDVNRNPEILVHPSEDPQSEPGAMLRLETEDLAKDGPEGAEGDDDDELTVRSIINTRRKSPRENKISKALAKIRQSPRSGDDVASDSSGSPVKPATRAPTGAVLPPDGGIENDRGSESSGSPIKPLSTRFSEAAFSPENVMREPVGNASDDVDATETTDDQAYPFNPDEAVKEVSPKGLDHAAMSRPVVPSGMRRKPSTNTIFGGLTALKEEEETRRGKSEPEDRWSVVEPRVTGESEDEDDKTKSSTKERWSIVEPRVAENSEDEHAAEAYEDVPDPAIGLASDGDDIPIEFITNVVQDNAEPVNINSAISDPPAVISASVPEDGLDVGDDRVQHSPRYEESRGELENSQERDVLSSGVLPEVIPCDEAIQDSVRPEQRDSDVSRDEDEYTMNDDSAISPSYVDDASFGTAVPHPDESITHDDVAAESNLGGYATPSENTSVGLDGHFTPTNQNADDREYVASQNHQDELGDEHADDIGQNEAVHSEGEDDTPIDRNMQSFVTEPDSELTVNGHDDHPVGTNADELMDGHIQAGVEADNQDPEESALDAEVDEILQAASQDEMETAAIADETMQSEGMAGAIQSLEEALERVLNERDQLALDLEEERRTVVEAADLVKAMESDQDALQARIVELEEQLQEALARGEVAPVASECLKCKETATGKPGSGLTKAAAVLVAAVIVQMLLLLYGM